VVDVHGMACEQEGTIKALSQDRGMSR
jgi:hypothetical protein